MAAMNFTRFPENLYVAIVDRKKENSYNEGCSETGASLIILRRNDRSKGWNEECYM